jgi:hypothetical protein
MSNEEYVAAGIRQQIMALERLLQDLLREPSQFKTVIPQIRAIETKLKLLRDSSAFLLKSPRPQA